MTRRPTDGRSPPPTDRSSSGAPLDDAAVVHHHHDVGGGRLGQTVGDDDRGTALGRGEGRPVEGLGELLYLARSEIDASGADQGVHPDAPTAASAAARSDTEASRRARRRLSAMVPGHRWCSWVTSMIRLRRG
ncbi:hypothetical protein OG496_03365 [Streptomyces sp. NBC_00988]|uniref:hypothetical protein n=1 Tax=Streptomyces sp. NBC_00988 TaxID=2903704 RepID=UPI003863DC36|nr:hypothetical protein OG496_03365 [Streptomyces sp. NBC_00988]